MSSKFSMLWTVPLLLGFSAAWADNHEEDEVGLPYPAADDARDVAQLPEAAADGLATAAEATMRLMEDDEAEVTNEVELPSDLPAAADFGQSVADQAINGEIDGQDIALEAQEAAEGRSRGEGLPEGLPGRPDDVPAGPPGT